MANPTRAWDRVPFWCVYRNPITGGPLDVTVEITASGTFTRVDGREIYLEGATVKVRAGVLEDQDPDVRAAVRDAWRAEDQARLGAQFDGLAWDVTWDTQIVPAGVFGQFPGIDDPDIVQTNFSATVVERLKNSQARRYPIQPRLAHLDLPIPGINLATIEVPPGGPFDPPLMYAKGIAGGVASLDETGKVPLAQLPSGIGGGGGVTDATATTLPYTEDATVELHEGILALGVPRGVPGAAGAKGDPGPPPVVITVDTVDDIIGMPAGTWALVLE